MSPYADPATMSSPWQSGSDTSHAGAKAGRRNAQARAAVMAGHYRAHAFTGLADFQMKRLTGFDINVINARRSDLGCVKVGKITGLYGTPVNTWGLPPEPQP